MDDAMARAQLLARFKLQVKRTLGETVDLEALTRDPQYARQRVSEIEDAATEEELLIMVLRIRDLLLPAPPVLENAERSTVLGRQTDPTSSPRISQGNAQLPAGCTCLVRRHEARLELLDLDVQDLDPVSDLPRRHAQQTRCLGLYPAGLLQRGDDPLFFTERRVA